MITEHIHNIESAFLWFQLEAHGLSKAKGWYENRSRSYMELYGLIVSELGELAEAFRATEMPESDKLPGFTLAEEEAADIYIRIADLCGYLGFRPGEVIAKWIINEGSTSLAYDFDSNAHAFCDVLDYLVSRSPILALIADEERCLYLHYRHVCDYNPMERIGQIARCLGHGEVFAYANYFIAAALVELACLANEHKLSLGDAILTKHYYNKGREPRHGGKLY